MNLIDLAPGRQVVGRITGPGRTNTFPARLVRIVPTEHGTWHATLVIQPDRDDVWDALDVHAITTSGPWFTARDELFSIRPETTVTVTALAEQIAWDGVATPELEDRIIRALGMDAEHVGGETLIGEDAAERAHAEILASQSAGGV